ncbi:FecR domain-containing protein [Ramlibacter tataouinensis]|uniref:FecR family protein n=1 Tax=Ramlibacter tataouinensis TaxID=94132 RepID=UPI0022F3A0B9|nr:FecR domain-containing protein [Ramlibacter tataouinensis]WBY03416.1 FecR domain-containing protein [Ramlibacter tataouinensis]
MRGQDINQALARLAAGALLALAGGAVLAQAAGEVEFARGVGFAQAPGQAPRTLGKGLSLQQGDRLTTSAGASAIVRLADGTRMTVRPNSELVLSQYQFKENAPDNGMLLQMIRGGFRAVTGLIAKGSPHAARVQTSTATIGIRGTDFDARLCARDCAAESGKVAERSRPNAVLASAKVVQAQGELFAVDAGNQRRRLVDGGSIYPGDVVETGAGTRAVIAFRDDTRITLGASTRFRVDNFVYDEQNAAEGRFLVSVLRGTVRALTGLIAKANNRNVGFATATATIGVRGTGLDIGCTGACAGEPPAGNDAGLTVFNWLGSVVVTPDGQTALQVLQAGQGLFISPTAGIVPISNPPAIDAPRPDGVAVPAKLFAKENVSDAQEGLFVFVRDGHIEVATAGEVLHLGRGEAGFAGQDGNTARPLDIPKFIDFDSVPLPTSRNPLLQSVLQDNNVRSRNTCS